jgi:hypothetical protein
MNDGDRVMVTFTHRGLPVTTSATCIRIWRRADVPQKKIGNAGEKEMFHNYACTALESAPQASAVALMHLPGPLILFIYQIEGRWIDRSGRRAEIAPMEAAAV